MARIFAPCLIVLVFCIVLQQQKVGANAVKSLDDAEGTQKGSNALEQHTLGNSESGESESKSSESTENSSPPSKKGKGKGKGKEKGKGKKNGKGKKGKKATTEPTLD